MCKKENVYHKVSNEILEDYIMVFVKYFKNYFKAENNEYFHAECYKSEHFIGIRFIIDVFYNFSNKKRYKCPN